MNYMAEVARMLGVEIDENFECKENGYTYCLTENGLTCNGSYASDILTMMLNGGIEIKRKPWKPQEDDEYYTVLKDGSVVLRYWDDCTHQINSYKIGNCYRTKEEALANRDKWIAFYASDDVFEVRHD
jgi:hypothetical protein